MENIKYEKVWCLIQLCLGIIFSVVGYFFLNVVVFVFIIGIVFLIKSMLDYIKLIINKKVK